MTARAPIPSKALLPFLALTFGLAWGLFALLVAMPETLGALFGPMGATNPLFVLAVYSPAIAAFLVVAIHGGRGAVARFAGRLALWRIPPAWLGFILVAIPAAYVLGAALKSGPLAAPLPEGGLAGLAGLMLFMLVLGPVEEFGWRGVALPILQRHLAPLWAGVVLGMIWGLWHLPAFFAEGTPQDGWPFLPFFAGAIAVSVILVPLFNATGGSLLWPVLFHYQLNNPLFPDGQPWDMAFFVVLAVIVVILNRETMLRRGAGVTQVA
jgi:membrane protease YdiL (CAAX protease family)